MRFVVVLSVLFSLRSNGSCNLELVKNTHIFEKKRNNNNNNNNSNTNSNIIIIIIAIIIIMHYFRKVYYFGTNVYLTV